MKISDKNEKKNKQIAIPFLIREIEQKRKIRKNYRRSLQETIKERMKIVNRRDPIRQK